MRIFIILEIKPRAPHMLGNSFLSEFQLYFDSDIFFKVSQLL